MVKGEGKTIITLVPERRILLYVMAMAGGVILAAAWPDAGVLTMLAAASAGMLSGVIAFRGHVGIGCRSHGGSLRSPQFPQAASRLLAAAVGDDRGLAC